MLHRAVLVGVFVSLVAMAAQAQTPYSGTVVRDCTDCPDMMVVPAGVFTMGSPANEAGRYESEGPQRVVTITRAFAVGRYEVTPGQFAAFVAESGYQSQGGNCWYWYSEQGKYVNDDASKSWRNPGFPQNDGHPVVCVSWTDAKAYIDWISKKTGKPYRLLSEAEWEYAGRSGTSTSRPWGDDPNQACRHANVGDLTRNRIVSPGKDMKWTLFHECDDGSAYTANVGSYQPNAFGLYDMIGNVWEWTEDCWNASFSGAPTDGSAWLTGDCALRVDRGASWNDFPRGARPANRDGGSTGNRNNNLGFRLASRPATARTGATMVAPGAQNGRPGPS